MNNDGSFRRSRPLVTRKNEHCCEIFRNKQIFERKGMGAKSHMFICKFENLNLFNLIGTHARAYQRLDKHLLQVAVAESRAWSPFENLFLIFPFAGNEQVAGGY